jgi:hypothetical protein
MDPRHLGRGELRLDLTAAGSGSLDGGHGRFVALVRLLHRRRGCRAMARIRTESSYIDTAWLNGSAEVFGMNGAVH